MRKEVLLTLVIGAVMFTACTEDSLNIEVSRNETVSAILPLAEQTTKTTLDENLQVVWNTGDAISVFSTTSESNFKNNQGTISDGIGTTEATFNVTIEGNKKVAAVYPYISTTTFNGTKASITMPTSYTYVENGIGGAPMAALISNQNANIAFQNAGALMGITVNNIPAGYNKATLTSRGAQALTGTCDITFDTNGVPTLVPRAETTGKEITITFEPAVTATNKTFFFPIPVQEYESLSISISSNTETKVLKTSGLNASRSVRYKSTLTLDQVTGSIPVASPNELQNAITNAEAGATINLGADITMSEILVIDKGITLNGNGYTLASTAGRAINVSGAEANGVTIQNLTIKCTGERGINIIQNATNVTIDNVTIDANNYAVNIAGSAQKAVVTIQNSDLTGLNVVNVGGVKAQVRVTNTELTNDNTKNDNNQYAILCLNRAATGGSSIAAAGCTFNCGINTVKGRNDTADGTVTIDGTTTDVVESVAYIDYGTYYKPRATFADIIDVAAAGNTITLIRDITVSEIITINKAITLDLNGKTLTEDCKLDADNTYAMLFTGDVTITGGTILTNSKFPIVIDNSTTRLNGGFTEVTITGTRKDNANNGALILIGNADVSIGTDVNITANHYHCAVESAAIDVNGNGAAKVTISEGAAITLQQATESETSTTIGAGYGSTINVTGGTINGLGAKYVASVFPTGGTINISGGIINGTLYKHEPYSGKTSTINVTGGTFSAEPPTEFVAEGYTASQIDDNSWTVSQNNQ